MATPKIIADFETQLSAAIAIGDTSFTLSSATDDDGVALPAGLYYFTLDNGSTNKEYLAGTLSGTTISSVLNVSRQGTESSGATKAHRVGATVIITDFNTYKKNMDEIALVSAPDASISAKGVLEKGTAAEIDADTATGATGAELAITPDQLVLSKYGTGLPTTDEKAALAGVGTPSSSNKYLTQGGNSDVVTFTTDGTWTKDTGLVRVRVQAWGGGGSGSSKTSAGPAPGGGGGGYFEQWFEASELGATETVTVGAGGLGVSGDSAGNTGADTTFGSLLTALNGTGGATAADTAAGGDGGDIQSGATLFRGAGATTSGGVGIFWGGGGGGGSNATTGAVGGGAAFGGGGGGGVDNVGTSTLAGGTSLYGGNGGASSNSGNGTAGTQPAGGGGGSVTGTSGAGADGQVIVTEYYS